MSGIFTEVLNMSMTGSVVILIVMLVRIILKRSPKIFSYALWAVVLFRLLCPVAFTAPMSVLNAFETDVKEASESTSIVYFIPAQVEQPSEFSFVPIDNQTGNDLQQQAPSKHTEWNALLLASYVWIIGAVAMLLYSVVQYSRLRMKLVGALACRGNIYRSDYIGTPFVCPLVLCLA